MKIFLRVPTRMGKVALGVTRVAFVSCRVACSLNGVEWNWITDARGTKVDYQRANNIKKKPSFHSFPSRISARKSRPSTRYVNDSTRLCTDRPSLWSIFPPNRTHGFRLCPDYSLLSLSLGNPSLSLGKKCGLAKRTAWVPGKKMSQQGSGSLASVSVSFHRVIDFPTDP